MLPYLMMLAERGDAYFFQDRKTGRLCCRIMDDNNVLLEKPKGEDAMTKVELEIHLFGIFIPLEPGDDETTTWIKVYNRWADECDKLGFSEEAQKYREKARSTSHST